MKIDVCTPRPTVVRDVEAQAVHVFLDRTQSGPAGLVAEGEAGIGKTTLLSEAAEAAVGRGFRVLSARGAPTEVNYAYAAVADLLRGMETALLADLPRIEAAALEEVLLGASDGPAVNERVVAAAFLSLIRHPGLDAPVLVCIDDAHCLDKSSQAVIGFAARRLTGPTGFLVAVRTEKREAGGVPPWLTFARPASVERLRVRPLTLGGVHAVISGRLGRTLPRPTITRIHEIAGGNPFFALELARSIVEDPSSSLVGLPDTLATLVHRRIGRPDDEVATVLLAAASAAVPTVERVSRAAGTTPTRVVELVESDQAREIVELDGNRIRFRHPLFATAVYTGSSPAQRRAMHGRLADVVDKPELRARHMALSATTADPATLEALDAAVEATQAHGAPAVTAELIELAIKVGGDTPARRLRAAELHFRSGAIDQARTHLQSTIDGLPPRSALRCVALMAHAALAGYDDSLVAAVDTLTHAIDEAADHPALHLRARLFLVPTTGLIGHVGESIDHARAAVADAERLGIAGLRSQALSIWALISFMYGLGMDRQALRSALESEDPAGGAAATFQASAVAAVISGWAGELETARTQLEVLQRRFLRAGTEIDILWAANAATMVDVWLGRYADAAATADDALQRAEQLAGKHMLASVWACQAAVAAYTGREDDARAAAGPALDTARGIGNVFQQASATAILGFLEVSLGNYPEALTTLTPLLESFDAVHGTEIVVGAYLPDAVEALTATGRVDEAEPLITALERNGARHDRPWMLAVGARGRSQWLAARGDLDAAEQAAQHAMSHHQRLPMPFETARTQLLLGQLQRRRRRRQAAEVTLREALDTFGRLGAMLWARRAEAELKRLTPSSGGGTGFSRLTASERRIAERAAIGLSNKQIAAELFIAPKTVEMNLSSVYRKLIIRSRAGLSTALDASQYQGNP